MNEITAVKRDNATAERDQTHVDRNTVASFLGSFEKEGIPCKLKKQIPEYRHGVTVSSLHISCFCFFPHYSFLLNI